QPAHQRRTGLGHRAGLDHLEARGVREVAHRVLVGLRHHPVRHRVRPGEHLRQGAQPGEEPLAMATATVHSVVEPSRRSKGIAGLIVVVYAVLSMVPLLWIFLTAWKSPSDSIAYPPKVVFRPTMDGYCSLFSTLSRQTPEYIAALPPPDGICDQVARARNMVVAGPSNFLPRFSNSLIIAFGSTALAVLLGVMSAYGFSRFRVPGKDDLLFFILSTRMMPPIAVAIPIYLMYRELGLSDTRLGMILLY